LTEIPHIVLVRDLAVVMMVAALVTLLFHRLHQPVVLGYLLAGFLIGPFTPPFPLVADEKSIRTLADLGVIFLMFSLGLQFSLRTLRQVGATAFVASALEILLMLWAGYQIGHWFGWSKMDSIFLGAMLSITSTTIIVKTLTDLGMLKAKFAHLIFGIQIVEDILGMTMIALLSGVAVTGSLEAGQLIGALGKIVAFLSVSVVVGLITVPMLLRYVVRFKSDEMLLVFVLGLCFGVTLLTVRLGYSIALGAFLVGTIIGECREIGKIKQLTEPVRDMFSAVFFVAMGMLIDPALLVKYVWPIVLITVIVVLGKTLAFSFGVFVTGHDVRTSLRVGTSMVPIGELSFIIASLGLTLGVTSEFLYPIAVCISAITMPLSPYLIKNSDAVVRWLDRVAPQWLLNYLEVYSRWVERLGSTQSRRDTQARRLARKWAWQIVLNVALITGAFMTAAAIAEPATRWWPNIPASIGGAKGLLWLIAAVVAMPGAIASVRKLQALAMLISEMSVRHEAAIKHTPALRSLIANTIFLAGMICLALWVLAVSAPFLPPGRALLILLLLVGMVAVLLWRFFIQIHAKAQVALREALAETPSEPTVPEEPLTTILRNAQLETLLVTETSPAKGKLIRQLELRSHTGASIVGIERAGTNIVNPSPDEELLLGDRLVLLGDRKQLDAAGKLLRGEQNHS
jgi:CPA2 family monovalent cation:H+ antiporter-2